MFTFPSMRSFNKLLKPQKISTLKEIATKLALSENQHEDIPAFIDYLSELHKNEYIDNDILGNILTSKNEDEANLVYLILALDQETRVNSLTRLVNFVYNKERGLRLLNSIILSYLAENTKISAVSKNDDSEAFNIHSIAGDFFYIIKNLYNAKKIKQEVLVSLLVQIDHGKNLFVEVLKYDINLMYQFILTIPNSLIYAPFFSDTFYYFDQHKEENTDVFTEFLIRCYETKFRDRVLIDSYLIDLLTQNPQRSHLLLLYKNKNNQDGTVNIIGNVVYLLTLLTAESRKIILETNLEIILQNGNRNEYNNYLMLLTDLYDFTNQNNTELLELLLQPLETRLLQELIKEGKSRNLVCAFLKKVNAYDRVTILNWHIRPLLTQPISISDLNNFLILIKELYTLYANDYQQEIVGILNYKWANNKSLLSVYLQKTNSFPDLLSGLDYDTILQIFENINSDEKSILLKLNLNHSLVLLDYDKLNNFVILLNFLYKQNEITDENLAYLLTTTDHENSLWSLGANNGKLDSSLTELLVSINDIDTRRTILRQNFTNIIGDQNVNFEKFLSLLQKDPELITLCFEKEINQPGFIKKIFFSQESNSVALQKCRLLLMLDTNSYISSGNEIKNVFYKKIKKEDANFLEKATYQVLKFNDLLDPIRDLKDLDNFAKRFDAFELEYRKFIQFLILNPNPNLNKNEYKQLVRILNYGIKDLRNSDFLLDNKWMKGLDIFLQFFACLLVIGIICKVLYSLYRPAYGFFDQRLFAPKEHSRLHKLEEKIETIPKDLPTKL